MFFLQIVTADGAVIEIGAEVYFQVKDAVHSVGNVQDLNHSTRIICQTSLQKQLGKQNLGDIESDRLIMSKAIQVRKRIPGSMADRLRWAM